MMYLILIFFVFLIFYFQTFRLRENFYLRSTRNQSYDLRGDPFKIHPTFMPWNMSTIPL